LEELQLVAPFWAGIQEGSKTEAEREREIASFLERGTTREKDSSLSGVVVDALARYGETPEQTSKYTGLALIRDGEHTDALGKLAVCETRLRNAIRRTLEQLYFVQAARSNGKFIDSVGTPSPSNIKRLKKN
jgi:hypothetical protein